MRIADWLRAKVTDHTPDVGRVFVVCGSARTGGCGRVIPYYRLYGRVAQMGCPHCGNIYFSPRRIPEWKAAWLVIWGYVSGKGDPRMPMRKAMKSSPVSAAKARPISSPISFDTA